MLFWKKRFGVLDGLVLACVALYVAAASLPWYTYSFNLLAYSDDMNLSLPADRVGWSVGICYAGLVCAAGAALVVAARLFVAGRVFWSRFPENQLVIGFGIGVAMVAAIAMRDQSVRDAGISTICVGAGLGPYLALLAGLLFVFLGIAKYRMQARVASTQKSAEPCASKTR
jgi:hypothetical protein